MKGGSQLAKLYDNGIGVTAAYEGDFLNELNNVLSDESISPKLTVHGKALDLPDEVLDLLKEVVQALMQGQVVTVVAGERELTSQESADILNVSRPYLVKLLEAGDIPFVKTGTHRRIRFSDLMNYKKIRDAERRRGLARLSQLSQEAGLSGT
jgi:excisionase family DNA binding protein